MRRYLYIDTKTGNYGEVSGARELGDLTNGAITNYNAWQFFADQDNKVKGKKGREVINEITKTQKERRKRMTYIDDRYIVLPLYGDGKEIYNDPDIIGSIVSIFRKDKSSG